MTLRRCLVILTLGTLAWLLLHAAGASIELTGMLVLPLVAAACVGAA